MPDKSETGKKARADGYAAETVAVWFLRAKGYRILERNFRPPRGSGAGEIDLIALKGDVLVFVEVKRRADAETAAYAMTPVVRKRRIKGAEYYLSLHPEHQARAMRFDAVLMANGLPHLIENAWETENF